VLIRRSTAEGPTAKVLDDQTRDAVRARAQRAADQTRDHRLRLARLASVKHGRPGFNWTTTYNYAWAKRLGVNDVGERLAGEPHEPFEGGGAGHRTHPTTAGPR